MFSNLMYEYAMKIYNGYVLFTSVGLWMNYLLEKIKADKTDTSLKTLNLPFLGSSLSIEITVNNN